MPADLFDQTTTELLAHDRMLLQKTAAPIITISASFRDVVEKYADRADDQNFPDITLSRAHYSMALGVAVTAWGSDQPDPRKAWVVDPTNYVTSQQWHRVALAETTGRLLARHSLLGWVKQNFIDKFGRQKFPLTREILPATLYLAENIQQPIISLHIATGNILAETGKKIIQVVTDPHVRPDYLTHANLPTMTYCVFDSTTRYEFLAMARDMGIKMDEHRVVVTGPPIDPRILACAPRKKTDSWRRRPLRVLLTTGGLGTNKAELETVLRALICCCHRHGGDQVQLMYYAGTNADHVQMVQAVAREHQVKIGALADRHAALRLLAADDIVDANNLLLAYGFPWADVVYTKPSGDMAYDAVAAGCAVFFLKPWGDWERNIQGVLTNAGVAQIVDLDHAADQLLEAVNRDYTKPWLEEALEKTRLQSPEFYQGARNILRVARQVAAQTTQTAQ